MRGLRGRPRKVVVEPEEEVSVEQEQAPEKPVVSNKRGGRIKSLRNIYVIPYEGVDKLQDADLDSRGKLKKAGEAQHFVNGNPSVGYKLLKIFRGQNNIVHRSLIKVMKPMKRTPRGAVDRQIINELKAVGIPGLL